MIILKPGSHMICNDRHGLRHAVGDRRRSLQIIWKHSTLRLRRSATNDLGDRESKTWFYFPDRYDLAEHDRF